MCPRPFCESVVDAFLECVHRPHRVRATFPVMLAAFNRYLAEQFPNAGKVVGIELSPHMLLTGRFMQQEDEVFPCGTFDPLCIIMLFFGWRCSRVSLAHFRVWWKYFGILSAYNHVQKLARPFQDVER